MWEKVTYWLLGLSEAGMTHSATTRKKMQGIHDTVAGMMGMDCAPKAESAATADGPESAADDVVQEVAEQPEETPNIVEVEADASTEIAGDIVPLVEAALLGEFMPISD